MKEIHLRAIELEMEIYMDGFQEEEQRKSQNVHQSFATKLYTALGPEDTVSGKMGH